MNGLTDWMFQAGPGVHSAGALVLQYALVLAAVGTFSMALVETVKSIFKLRRVYNRWAVRQWTHNEPRNVDNLFSTGNKGDNPVLAELELLAIGGHDDVTAFYDQPVEKFMGQVQSAVNLAFEFPDAYPHLYKWITRVPTTFFDRKADGALLKDQEVWAQGAIAVRKIRSAHALSKELMPVTEADQQVAVTSSPSRTRLTNLIARKLDAFQTETQYFWQRLNQWGAGSIGAIIFWFGVRNFAGQPASPELLVLAVIAGALAPFAKDLSSALSSFGDGK